MSRDRNVSDRQNFVTLIENVSDFIGMCDLDGVPFFVNRAGLDMVGLASIEEACRTSVADFFFPDDRKLIIEQFFPHVLKHGRGEIEIRFRHFKTGEARWMAYKVVVLTNEAGQPTGYATVSQDITERKQLNDDLRRLAADLSEIDRRKNEFLATLAHELRNPLMPICNMLEVVKLAAGDEAVVRRALDIIERQLGQMVRLVDDLLDLNRITRGRLELRRSEVALASVVQLAVEVAKPLLEASGHELIIELPEEPVYLDADGARLVQLFGNLLNNSCKYTRPDGTIWFTAERTKNDVVVKVRDNGAGIPPDKLGRIFDMFMQVEATAGKSQGGLGIGLTLVKRLAEMHGGTIEARSGGEGQGSEFIVTLPVFDRVERLLRPASEPSGLGLLPCRILIVDDNFDSAESLALLFQTMGSTTCLAHDGVEALSAIEKYTPEVVLLDIGLPKLDGHEVCRRVRSQPWGKDIIMIALTGWGQEEDRRMSEDAGFDGHIVKPVHYDQLEELLASLGKRRSVD